MLSPKYKSKNIIELLLHGSIDIFAANTSGKNALVNAVGSGHNV